MQIISEWPEIRNYAEGTHYNGKRPQKLFKINLAFSFRNISNHVNMRRHSE